MQARLAYCAPKGIPLSEFLSWDENDQDMALAWQGQEARRCSSCGTHPDEWNEDEGGSRSAYVAEVVVCPGCQQVQAAQDADNPQLEAPGARIMLTPFSEDSEG